MIKGKFRLLYCSSITGAELYAVLCDLEYVYHNSARQIWVILVYPQLALLSLQSNNIYNSNTVSLVYRIILAYTKLVALNNSVKFQWISGHCRIEQNVEGNRVVGEPHDLPISEYILLSTGPIRRLLRKLSARLCQEKCFDQQHQQSAIYAVYPHFTNAHTCISQSADGSFHRLRFGVTFTNYFYTVLLGQPLPSVHAVFPERMCRTSYRNVINITYCSYVS